jgi:ABC-type proline/glycine betaine transport system permease subunit
MAKLKVSDFDNPLVFWLATMMLVIPSLALFAYAMRRLGLGTPLAAAGG